MISHDTSLDSPTVSSKEKERKRLAQAMAEYEARTTVETTPVADVNLAWPLRLHRFSHHIDALRKGK